jgi:light-regulated signal transduction histidine kinase (bacteriophytochrome)
MIGSYVQLIQRRYQGQLDPDADDFISYVVEGVDRMQRLLRDLLEYARVGYRGLQVHLIDSSAALDDAVTNLKIAVEESGAAITYSTLPRIKADRLQLTRLFQNLISNCIKFRRDLPLQVHVSAARGEGEWIFSVRDNAMGFDEAFAKKAFVIFQRLHGREYPGTGIGLAISKRIVERRGGRIWVESESGVGSTFYFSVPDGVRAESPAVHEEQE